MNIAPVYLSELESTDDYIQYCTLLKQLTVVNIETIQNDSFKAHLEIIKSNPLHKIIIAKSNNNIIGTVTILIEPKIIHDLSYVAHIEDVVVDSTYRGIGTGKLLMEYAIKLSKKYKCYKIIFDCSDSNIGFYKKLGFKVKENQMAMYI